MAQSDPIEIIRGDDVSVRLTFTDADDAVISLVGATVFFTVKKKLDTVDADADISKTITSHTDAAGGITTADLTNDDTDLEPGTYYYDIQIKKSGRIQSTRYGVFTVIEDVTNRES